MPHSSTPKKPVHYGWYVVAAGTLCVFAGLGFGIILAFDKPGSEEKSQQGIDQDHCRDPQHLLSMLNDESLCAICHRRAAYSRIRG